MVGEAGTCTIGCEEGVQHGERQEEAQDGSLRPRSMINTWAPAAWAPTVKPSGTSGRWR